MQYALARAHAGVPRSRGYLQPFDRRDQRSGNNMGVRVRSLGLYLKYIHAATAIKTTARTQREESLIPVFLAMVSS